MRLNCIAPAPPPKSKPNSIAIPTTSAVPVNRMPRPRISRSRLEGTRAITTAPTAGRNVAIVIAELSQVISPSPSSSDSREDECEDRDPREQEHGVALHVSGLQVLEKAAREAGGLPDGVNGAVDAAAVEDVDDLAEPSRQRRRSVDDAVDHVGVEPVDAAGDRILGRADDPAEIEVVEVVLVLEDAVGGPERAERIRRPVPVVDPIAQQQAE